VKQVFIPVRGVLAQPPRGVVVEAVSGRGLMSGQSFADASEIELATRVATPSNF
jgi:hypothetical protein